MEKGATKKEIRSIIYAKELDLVFVLAEAVYVFSYGASLKFESVLSDTRNASLIKLHRYLSTSEDSMASMITLLGVAVKKKIRIFKWVDSVFDCVEEWAEVKDKVNSFDFISFDSVLVGTDGGSYMVVCSDSRVNALFNCSSHMLVERLSEGNDEIVVHSGGGNCIFLGKEGKPTRDYGITFGINDLRSIYICYPYILGISALTGKQTTIEIRSIVTNSLIQTIQTSAISCSCSYVGQLYYCCGSELLCLTLKAVADQVAELISQSLFDEALLLGNTGTIGFIVKIKKGIHLCLVKNDYEQGLKLLFALLPVSLIVDLLFPTLNRKSSQPEPGLVSILKRFRKQSLSKSADLEPPEAFFTPSDSSQVIKSKEETTGISYDDLSEIRRFIASISKEIVLTKENLQALIGQLTEKRRTSNSEVIDTMLLRCYLKTNIVLVGSLVRLKDNMISIPVAEELLHTEDKVKYLLDLYATRDMHESALLLLKELGYITETVAYMKQMEDITLVLKYCSWIPWKEEVSVFVHSDEYVVDLSSSWDESLIVKYFESHQNVDACVAYLDYLVQQTNAPEYHNLLASKHLYRITNFNGEEIGPLSKCTGTLRENRMSFIHFLQTSSYYKAEIVHSMIMRSNKPLLEERAIVLMRLKQHEKALLLYVSDLKEVQLAFEYLECLHDEYKEVGAMLVQILVQHQYYDECLSFLASKGHLLNFEKVILK